MIKVWSLKFGADMGEDHLWIIHGTKVRGKKRADKDIFCVFSDCFFNFIFYFIL